MLNNQKAEFERLQSEQKNLSAENVKLRPALQELQGQLTALENYTRRENLRFSTFLKRRVKTVPIKFTT